MRRAIIIEGKSEIYAEKGAINAIDAIHQKVDKATNKQDIGDDKWTDRIKRQKLSVESHKKDTGRFGSVK